ncbi:uncharacterized protein [Solanum lycopersicum]|uniref:uncharacterized protein isoform X2 n=1 Tax=Solanum lycopersicum TaxID=4081 RepID=UPI003747D43F
MEKEKKAKEEKEKNEKEEKEKKAKQEKENEKGNEKKAKEMEMEKQKVKAKAKKKGKKVEVVSCDVNPFEGFNIDGEGPTELMSSFSQWIKEGLYKHHAKKGNKEDNYLANCSKLEFEELNLVVTFPMNKDWFYIMSQPNRCWNDEANPCSLLYVLFCT